MEIEFNKKGEHKIIQLTGNLDLYNANKLKKALSTIFDGRTKSVIVDLKDVDYMDSSIINALLACKNRMGAVQGNFALMNIQRDVFHSLKLSNLDLHFKILKDNDEIN